MGPAAHPPVSRSSRRLLGGLLAPLLVALLGATAMSWPDRRSDRRMSGAAVSARLVAARVAPCPDTVPEAGIECVLAEATLGDGTRVSLRPVPVERVEVGEVTPGRRVVLRRTGGGDLVAYDLGGPTRARPLALAAATVALLAVVVLRRQFLRLAGCLAGIAVVTFGHAVPALDAGRHHLLVAAVAGGWAVVLVGLARARPTARHVAAAVAALLAVLLAAAGLDRVVGAAELDGFEPGPTGDGLLLLSVVVGAAAAAAALALRQVDHTWDLRDTDPGARWWTIAGGGLRRGREDAQAMAAVLAVVVLGAGLPETALFAGPGPLGDVLVNGVAGQLVRLLGALGVLLLAVPAASAVAAAVAVREGRAAPATDPRRFRARAERDLWEG